MNRRLRVRRSAAGRGQTLLETSLAVGIALLALAAFAGYRLSGAQTAGIASVDGLPAIVAQARATAAGSGDGATLAFAQDPALKVGSQRFEVALYRYRPRPGSAFDPARPLWRWRLSGAVRGSTGPGAFAVFISSAGTASFAAWTPEEPPLFNEPACTGPLRIVVAANPLLASEAPLDPPPGPRAGRAWFAMDCADARLVAR